MADTHTLPPDVLPCLGGDAIVNLHGLLSVRLTPEQQHELAARLPALNGSSAAAT